MIMFQADMLPIGKARARTVRVKSGKVMSFTPSKTTAAEIMIRLAFRQTGADMFASEVPLAMIVGARMPRPKSCPKKRTLPATKPDPDNILKLVMDALQGFAYPNDSQIVSLALFKRYCHPGEPPFIKVIIFAHQEAPDNAEATVKLFADSLRLSENDLGGKQA